MKVFLLAAFIVSAGFNAFQIYVGAQLLIDRNNAVQDRDDYAIDANINRDLVLQAQAGLLQCQRLRVL